MPLGLLGTLLLAALAAENSADAASFRTRNFLIDAETPQLARSVGQAAERFRRDLAKYWLDRELPPWPYPCPIRVIAGPTLAAQGVTQYNQNPVRDFQMEVVGTPQRILDSVLPHEVTHTILATHFGRPLPRWADEGICTTVEHPSERAKHEAKLREFLASRRGIAMNKLFQMKEYPSDILPMYAQGHSVCQFLILQKGPQTFIRFLTDFMQRPSWTHNIRKHYGYESLTQLQQRWVAWVAAGSGPVERFAANPPVAPEVVASTATPRTPVSLASLEVPPRRQNLGIANAVAWDPDKPRPLISGSADPWQGDSWYARNRSTVNAQESAAISIASMAPPSVRRTKDYPASGYQTASPQAEGGR
ncbi:MAG: hypothetical protein AAF958_15605 [Planctomycetota bacterium]